MKLAIKIDDKLYNRIKYLEPKADTMLDELMRCVQSGTPLPEHHGRLIDADALTEKAPEIQEYLDVLAPTIIEADKESK